MNHWLKIALLTTLPVISHAHTMSPYLIPEVFDTKTNNVSFQSGITVEKFYVPTANFKTDYVVTAPDGKNTPVKAAANLKRFNIGEFDLAGEGTYRIRTEGAQGANTKFALVDGRWLRVRPARPMNAAAPAPQAAKAPTAAPAPANAPTQPPRMIAADQVPANAQILDVANHYIAESFVTKGKPSAVPAVTNKGFELKLVIHPNQLFTGESLKAVALYNGKAIPNLEMDVFKGASSYDANANREQPAVKTNAKGEFEIPFKDAGIYLITTAYREPNPDNTKKPNAENFTYGLTVEVTD